MPGGFEVLVDAFSMNYLKGATVDYVETLEASGFKITNPNATGTCGCGQSFDS
jgi:iron-sulfur cluster assembly protein